MYAVITTGGKQYKVAPGMELDVERFPEGEVGKSIKLKEVLAVRKDKKFEVGRPHIKGAIVVAEVVKLLRAPKVISYKFKRRKGYHKKIGHRQNLTRLKIVEITLNGT